MLSGYDNFDYSPHSAHYATAEDAGPRRVFSFEASTCTPPMIGLPCGSALCMITLASGCMSANRPHPGSSQVCFSCVCREAVYCTLPVVHRMLTCVYARSLCSFRSLVPRRARRRVMTWCTSDSAALSSSLSSRHSSRKYSTYLALSFATTVLRRRVFFRSASLALKELTAHALRLLVCLPVVCAR